MAADEWRAATVAKVCQAAGLNKRYFYESFTDLDTLAAAVVEETARLRCRIRGHRIRLLSR